MSPNIDQDSLEIANLKPRMEALEEKVSSLFALYNRLLFGFVGLLLTVVGTLLYKFFIEGES